MIWFPYYYCCYCYCYYYYHQYHYYDWFWLPLLSLLPLLQIPLLLLMISMHWNFYEYICKWFILQQFGLLLIYTWLTAAVFFLVLLLFVDFLSCLENRIFSRWQHCVHDAWTVRCPLRLLFLSFFFFVILNKERKFSTWRTRRKPRTDEMLLRKHSTATSSVGSFEKLTRISHQASKAGTAIFKGGGFVQRQCGFYKGLELHIALYWMYVIFSNRCILQL